MQNIDKDKNVAFMEQGQFRKRAAMEKDLNESQKQKHNWQEGSELSRTSNQFK